MTRVSCPALRSLLAFSFIVISTQSTFCPVTSPTEQLVYVTDAPSKVVIVATLPQCGLECQESDAASRRNAGQPGCRCFNYNSTSENCSLFTFEPTNFGVDRQWNTVAYQVRINNFISHTTLMLMLRRAFSHTIASCEQIRLGDDGRAVIRAVIAIITSKFMCTNKDASFVFALASLFHGCDLNFSIMFYHTDSLLCSVDLCGHVL